MRATQPMAINIKGAGDTIWLYVQKLGCKWDGTLASIPANGTAYGEFGKMAGHLQPMNSTVTSVPTTPKIETGASAVRLDKLQSGNSAKDVTPKILACRVNAHAGNAFAVNGAPRSKLDKDDPITRLKVRAQPKQYAKDAMLTTFPDIFRVSEDDDEECILLQSSPILLA